MGLGAPALFFLMPGHNISVWWPLVKPPLPAPDLSRLDTARAQHLTEREVHVVALGLFTIITYKLLHRDPKALQGPVWDPGNTVMATPSCCGVCGRGRALHFPRPSRGTRPAGTQPCLQVQPLQLS